MTMGLWRLADPLLLASGSATRRALLESAALPVEVERPAVDERAIEAAARHAGAGSAAVARALAAAKALDVSTRRPGRLVLGADQTLDRDGTAFHKPECRAEAADQIRRLSGRAHTLHAAVALARDGAILAEIADAARLTMRPLSEEAIELYLDLAGDAVLASVGAYQVEGVGVHLFERIEGDHSTILGLPLLPTLAALRGLGALSF
jgi:septum formation protein